MIWGQYLKVKASNFNHELNLPVYSCKWLSLLGAKLFWRRPSWWEGGQPRTRRREGRIVYCPLWVQRRLGAGVGLDLCGWPWSQGGENQKLAGPKQRAAGQTRRAPFHLAKDTWSRGTPVQFAAFLLCIIIPSCHSQTFLEKFVSGPTHAL